MGLESMEQTKSKYRILNQFDQNQVVIQHQSIKMENLGRRGGGVQNLDFESRGEGSKFGLDYRSNPSFTVD